MPKTKKSFVEIPDFHITRCTICVPLNRRQWDRLMEIDDDSRRDWERRYNAFIKAIEKSGGDEVEFNGHFGRNFYFSVEKLTHAPRVVRKLVKRIGT